MRMHINKSGSDYLVLHVNHAVGSPSVQFPDSMDLPIGDGDIAFIPAIAGTIEYAAVLQNKISCLGLGSGDKCKTAKQQTKE
jgi:hypothetical protein